VGDAFISRLVDEVEYVWLAWRSSRTLYRWQGVYGRSFEAIEVEVPLERNFVVVRACDGGSVVEGCEYAEIM
jgi:hypothetical protein